MEEKNLPNDLNLQTSQRLSSLLLFLLLLFLAVNLFRNNVVLLPLLTGLFLLVVNGWHWQKGPVVFKLGRRTAFATYGLIVAIILLALSGQVFELVYVSILLLLATLAGRFLTKSSHAPVRLLFSVMMLTLAAGFIVLLAQYPVWLITPTLLIMVAIVLLNHRLYSFFLRRRGMTFAIAVLPLQLFYYFYSVLTFAVSGGLHMWNGRLGTE
jgi:hypothetical protein